MSAITRAASTAVLKLKKHSPTILFAAGIVGSVSTVVVACRATLKAQYIAEDHKNTIVALDKTLQKGEGYTKDDHKHDIVVLWRNTSAAYVKLYGPAFILGLTSIACLTKSHQILTSRNAAVMAAYAGLDQKFRQYRGRVIAELGEQKDTEFSDGSVEHEIVSYDDKGNAKVERIKRAADGDSIYGRWFDETNRHWSKDPGYNHTFLDNQQRWANIQLKARGHIFLNEVYDLIGLERTKEGALVGWVYNKGDGDGYVDFGFNRYPDFIAGFERSVKLDFNVDGVIYDLI